MPPTRACESGGRSAPTGRVPPMSRRFDLACCLLLVVAACDSEPHYVGVGDVLDVDEAVRQVTIRHDEIAGLMDAGTTRFAVPSDEPRAALTPGARVRFEVRRTGPELVVTRATALAQGNPGIHDHTPHHGGIVGMAGMIHLEAKATADGRVQLYLTDLWRRPLPLDDVGGTVTLDLPAGKQALSLAVVGDALAATGPPLEGPTVNATFALHGGEEPVELSFLLPLGRDDTGAAGIPVEGCVAPAESPSGTPAPRCALAFARPVVALAVAPDAATLLVAQVDLGVSAWRLPAVAFATGFAPPPPVVVPVAEPPHREAPNAVLVRPDGREAVVAMENRLIRYGMDSGRVVRAFDGPGGIVRGVAWSPDGGALLVSVFYNAAAFLLDAGDGRVLRRFPVEREAAAVAFAPDGQAVAVASEAGPVTLFDIGATAPPRLLRGPRGVVRSLAFAGGRLVAAGNDGVLRVWDRASGALRIERPLVGPLYEMAVDAARGLVATTGTDPRIEVTRLADGAPVVALSWHPEQVLSLAWAGSTLISGDAGGRVALWNVADGDRGSGVGVRVSPAADQTLAPDSRSP